MERWGREPNDKEDEYAKRNGPKELNFLLERILNDCESEDDKNCPDDNDASNEVIPEKKLTLVRLV